MDSAVVTSATKQYERDIGNKGDPYEHDLAEMLHYELT